MNALYKIQLSLIFFCAMILTNSTLAYFQQKQVPRTLQQKVSVDSSLVKIVSKLSNSLDSAIIELKKDRLQKTEFND